MHTTESIPDTRVIFHRGGLVFGLLDGRPAHVDDVANGLACRCVCDYCSAPLVARNHGEILRSHFAHAAGVDCENRGEGGLARSIAILLGQTSQLRLPPTWTGPLDQAESRIIAAERVEAVTPRGAQPEVHVWTAGRQLRLFVRPSHRLSREFRAHIARDKISAMLLTIPPDMDGVIRAGEARRALSDPSFTRIWLYNARSLDANAAPMPRQQRAAMPAREPASAVEERPPPPRKRTVGESGPRFCWRCGRITNFTRAGETLACSICGTLFLG